MTSQKKIVYLADKKKQSVSFVERLNLNEDSYERDLNICLLDMFGVELRDVMGYVVTSDEMKSNISKCTEFRGWCIMHASRIGQRIGLQDLMFYGDPQGGSSAKREMFGRLNKEKLNQIRSLQENVNLDREYRNMKI